MTDAVSLHERVRAQLAARLADPATDEVAQLNEAMRLLAKWRSVLIQNTVLTNIGTTVLQGPLRGMEFLPRSAEGCHVAKLLGCYEQPLQPHVEAAMATPYATIANIGCAEGYYAVGMARSMAGTRILARDTAEAAQSTARELAAKNGVADRIEIGGLFTTEDFGRLGPGRVLVFCDIEGAERDLLDPAKAPALAGMDIIVESHECLLPGITRLLIDRFSVSHDITVVEDDGQRRLDPMPAWFYRLAHLDQLLAVWEWRDGPTPWLVMKAKRPAT